MVFGIPTLMTVIIFALAFIFFLCAVSKLLLPDYRYGDYPDLRHTLSPNEWSRRKTEHEEEVTRFLKEIEGRRINEWKLEEIAEYESIRRREAIYGF